jgi:Putative beta-barrel porin-2, OmpL-like. bbp2
MRVFITVAALSCVLAVALVPSAARAQGVNGTEAQALKEEIRRLNERLNRLEQAGQPRVAPAAAPAPVAPVLPVVPAAATAPVAPASAVAPAAAPPAVASPPAPPPTPAGLVAAQAPPPTPGEKEVSFLEHPLNLIGLPKPEIGGFRFRGFFVASANYNSHIQIVPEFAGGAEAKSAPGNLNFRFDKFGLGVSRVFADWLYAGATMEVESHADSHSHLIDATTATRLGCPPGIACERFGAETPATEAVLDKFNLTVVAPLGNGVPISFARFDIPFGFERHDEVLNLTATTSEVFRYGRPQMGTGFNIAYQFTPWLDAQAWVVNRWESETTHDPFDDNNRDKSWGGRVGFTPIAHDGILNFGIGAAWGPEQTSNNSEPRWVIDADLVWQPNRRILVAGEMVYGYEQKVSTRQVGIPVVEPARRADRSWFGFYVLGYYEPVDWLGIVARYGFFNDIDGSRTGVEQQLNSITIAPIFHLSRLIPDLKPTGSFFTRSMVPIDWVNVKLEYRFNYSTREAFSNNSPNTAILDGSHSSHQVQLQVNVNF